eukprot:3449380-Pleurochrysis_carterae.AAC.3
MAFQLKLSLATMASEAFTEIFDPQLEYALASSLLERIALMKRFLKLASCMCDEEAASRL